MIVIFSSFFAIISRTVVSAPRPPAPNMFTRLFTPLHKGRGKPRKRRGGRGSCMEDGARRPEGTEKGSLLEVNSTF